MVMTGIQLVYVVLEVFNLSYAYCSLHANNCTIQDFQLCNVQVNYVMLIPFYCSLASSMLTGCDVYYMPN